MAIYSSQRCLVRTTERIFYMEEVSRDAFRRDRLGRAIEEMRPPSKSSKPSLPGARLRDYGGLLLSEKSLPLTEEKGVRDWLEKHKTAEGASFVYRAWLDAAGEKGIGLVEEGIREWLEKHRTAEDASFVYRAWLDAAGEKGISLVEVGFQEWLEKHPEHKDLDYALRAWLEAGGQPELVRVPALRWLHQHCREKNAAFLLKSIVALPNLPAATIVDVLTWCAHNCCHEDAPWRLAQLRQHLRSPAIAPEIVGGTEVVLGAIEKRGTRDVTEAGLVASVLLSLVQNGGMRSRLLRKRVDNLFARWLKSGLVFHRATRVPRRSQSPAALQRVLDLVRYGKLDVRIDHDSIGGFLDWIRGWDEDRRAQLTKSVRWAFHNLPEPGLWERAGVSLGAVNR
jgi:hypothetical protein